MDLKYPNGATPLDKNETEGLIPTNITTREELDRWEQDNINEAIVRLERRSPKDILTEQFIKRLHKQMFGNVWQWAGRFRQSEKNIGVPWHRIPTDLKSLCDDARFWIEKETYPQEEIAVRFHHRLVSIHPFPNGNGRHARLMTDVLLEIIFKKSRFSWGSGDLINSGDCRRRYIDALHAADKFDYGPLLQFAKS